MNNKYATGKYHIYFFDRYGTQEKSRMIIAETLHESMQIAKEQETPGGSVSIVHVVFNSRDNRWRGEDMDVDAVANAARQVV